AMMLLGLTGALLALEARVLRGRRYARTGGGAARHPRRARLGGWAVPAYAFAALVALASVGLPAATIVYRLSRVSGAVAWGDLGAALSDSARASLPAALLSAGPAVPVAYLGVRMPSGPLRLLARVAYLCYATPPLA